MGQPSEDPLTGPGQQFAPRPPNGLASNSNYFLCSPTPIVDLVVDIYVGEEIVSDVGFGFQVNCWSAIGPLCQWQQYVIAMLDNDRLSWSIQNWNTDMSVNCVNAGNNATVGAHPWVPLPAANTIPAGWRILIALSNDALGNVAGFSFVVLDNESNTRGAASGELIGQPNFNGTASIVDLAPIVAVQVTLVGPTTASAGPMRFGSTRLTSGAGTITYLTTNPVTPLAVPLAGTTGFDRPVAGSSLATGESANSSYGVLPAGPGTSLPQTFGTLPALGQWVALDGSAHVHEFRSADAIQWQNTDATQAANNTQIPVSYSGLSGYQWPESLSKMVVYLDSSGHVNELMATPTRGWTHADLTSASGAPAASADTFAVSGYSWAEGGSKQVVYFDQAQHVIEVFIAKGMKRWGNADLTARTSGAVAVSGSSICGYEWPLGNSKQVVYLDIEGHVHELYCGFGSDWGHADLSQMTSAPAAAPDSPLCGYSWDVGRSKQVVYFDSGGHVHELWIVAGSIWKHADLTELAGAPPAVYGSDIVGYQWAAGRSKQVVYYDGAGHVHELWIVAGSHWKHADLTALTGAPPADLPSGLAAFQSMTARSKQVAYLGASGHIHQLRIASGGAWGHIDITEAAGAPPM
ncbi:MAG TPA: hypothetical protein VGS21_03145, partial [Acidimicrobiales bacterium]|nr:hypothetical protein [Acidimicrobiales bacterium]